MQKAHKPHGHGVPYTRSIEGNHVARAPAGRNVNVFIPNILVDKLDAEARRIGVTRDAMIRACVEEYFSKAGRDHTNVELTARAGQYEDQITRLEQEQSGERQRSEEKIATQAREATLQAERIKELQARGVASDAELQRLLDEAVRVRAESTATLERTIEAKDAIIASMDARIAELKSAIDVLEQLTKQQERPQRARRD